MSRSYEKRKTLRCFSRNRKTDYAILRLQLWLSPIAMIDPSACSSAPRPAFGSQSTGKERDETGLDYFGARYYSGAQGRFTSPDDIKYGRINDPQTWNLYTYSRNGPLTRIDADGHNWFEIGGQWEWHEGEDYFDKKRMKNSMHSDYTHLLVARASGY